MASLLVGPTIAQSADQISVGTFQIRQCDAGQANSMAADLITLIKTIQKNMQAVIDDANLGIDSTHGYEALFHSSSNIDYVRKVLLSIALGPPIPDPDAKDRATAAPLFPTIVCLRPDDPKVAGLYHHCLISEGAGAGFIGNSVVLCPRFWEVDDKPGSWDCPRLRKGRLHSDEVDLTANKESALVHELAHMYGADLGGLNGEETYGISDVTRLAKNVTLKNAQNYAYYYACE